LFSITLILRYLLTGSPWVPVWCRDVHRRWSSPLRPTSSPTTMTSTPGIPNEYRWRRDGRDAVSIQSPSISKFVQQCSEETQRCFKREAKKRWWIRELDSRKRW
jgi:hypothetical protein